MTQHHTYTEILSQPEAWSQAIQVVQENGSAVERLVRPPLFQMIFTGCGSTYYLALAGAALYQELTGQPARAVPASELLLNPQTVLASQRQGLIAISRSGSTTETIRAVERFRDEKRGPVLAITNYGQEPLARLADLALVISKGQERSVAQTRSFASMYLAAVAVAGVVAAASELLRQMQALPKVGERLLVRYHDLAREYGDDLGLERIYYLGSGMRYGLACEAALKMKEMSLTHSEAFHCLEFRHGPMAMVNASALVVGLLSERNRAHEQAVLTEMRQLNARTLSLAEQAADVAFESGVVEAERGVLYLPVLQLMAYYRALAKGLNPDLPKNLSAVVRLAI